MDIGKLPDDDYDELVLDYIRRHGCGDYPSGNLRTDAAMRRLAEKKKLIKDGDVYRLFPENEDKK